MLSHGKASKSRASGISLANSPHSLDCACSFETLHLNCLGKIVKESGFWIFRLDKVQDPPTIDCLDDVASVAQRTGHSTLHFYDVESVEMERRQRCIPAPSSTCLPFRSTTSTSSADTLSANVIRPLYRPVS